MIVPVSPKRTNLRASPYVELLQIVYRYTTSVKALVAGMEALAAVLTAKPVPLSAEDRAKFAAAMKKSMDAVLHCRT